MQRSGMLVKLSEEQYNELYDKYKKLITYIAKYISQDNSKTKADYKQDLRLALIGAVDGFYNQVCNGEYEQFKDTKGFDQYVKTCLWNCKNNTGANNKKRKEIHYDVADIVEYEDVIPDTSSSSHLNSSKLKFAVDLDADEQTLLKCLLQYKDSFKQNGSLNIAAISKRLNAPALTINRILYSLKDKAAFVRGITVD